MRARLLLLPILLALLSACGGGASGANGSDPFGTGSTPSTVLSLSLLDSDCDAVSEASFTTNEDICVQATLTIDGVATSGEIISFSLGSAIGDLSASTALTNSQGIAEVVISNSSGDTGADSITASYESESVTLSYEYAAVETSLHIAVLDSSCNNVSVPSFLTNQNICIQAVLTSDSTPVSGEMVTFSLSDTLGNLVSTTALTNSNGVAQVAITNPDANVGASTVVATYSGLSETANYEYLSLPAELTEVPEVTLTMLKNGSAVSRFRTDETVQLRAKVIDANDIPIENVIVTFSLQGTGPVLEPSTGLTDVDGVATVGLSAGSSSLGAYSVQADVAIDSFSYSDSLNFEVKASDTVIDESATRFGHIDSEGEFIEGIVGSSAEINGEVIISAGATAGFNVALVDENGNRLQTPTPVTFSSTCVTNGQATIDESVTTINGVASATFEDLNCAGSTGNSDQIIASVTINNTTLSISRTITILPEDIGSIAFISATPEEIVLAGTGGQNNASVSTLVFQVNGELGNPLAQQIVDFSLNTSVGGLTISPTSGLTNSLGQVSTRVTAGTVPTAVRVTAKAIGNDGQEIRTQSDLLSVNTGLPDQNSFTLSASILNPEAATISGQTATITVRLADSFNNPVPNGTTVNFTTEGGDIESTCSTGENEEGVINPEANNTGTCSVTWTSSNPVPTDHRITILATAIGHETLFDSNGNNSYDDDDGGPISDGSDAGFSVSQYGNTGFVDMSEAWLDINENGVRDSFELPFDYNNNGEFDEADGLFSGPQCISDSMCGNNGLHVRKALVMITSGSTAYWRAYIGDANDPDFYSDANIAATNDPNVTVNASLTVLNGESKQIALAYYDTSEQVMPFGTVLGVLGSDGSISSTVDSVPNTNQREIPEVPGNVVIVTNNTDTLSSTELNYAIDAPSGSRTSIYFTINP